MAPATDCTIWEGAKNPRGYGNVMHQRKTWKAHRLAWVEANGPIPAGMFVLHRCDNPSCVNVEHLFLGTQTDNMQDMARKGRGRSGFSGRTHCRRGHEYTEENTLHYRNARYCRACRRDRERRASLEGRR